MKNNITNLSNIGLSKFYLDTKGKIYNIDTKREIKADKDYRLYLVDDSGKRQRISLKVLYRKAYNKEFCYDDIIDLPQEQWKEISGTNGKYYISNCGRVKSYCKYRAKILKYTVKKNGYHTVKISGRNKMIHRLVALEFCQNNYIGQEIQIHHIDGNKANNKADNLQILSFIEHIKIHNKKVKEL